MIVHPYRWLFLRGGGILLLWALGAIVVQLLRGLL